MTRAFFLVHSLGPVSLARASDAIIATASTAAVAADAEPPHLGIAALSRKGTSGDARLQLLVRPNKLNLRELHGILPKLPAADPPSAAGSAAPASEAAAKPVLGLALKAVIEHLCSYPDHGQRPGHVFVMAHGFAADPLVLRVMQACAQLGVEVHFVQMDEPGAPGSLPGPEGGGGGGGGGGEGGRNTSAGGALAGGAGEQRQQEGGDVQVGGDQGQGQGGAAPPAPADQAAAARPGFAAAVARIPFVTFMRLTPDCDEAVNLLASHWLRQLMAPPPLPLALKLPRPLCGSDTAALRAMPRLLPLRPLLQPGVLCPCHGEPLLPPAAPALGGWPGIEQWRCDATGLPLHHGTEGAALATDSSLLQLGAHTLLRMPITAMAAASRGFCRALGAGEAAALKVVAAVPAGALDAQLLVGPALLLVPSPDAGDAPGASGAPGAVPVAGGDGGAVVAAPARAENDRRVRALCASLRARGEVLLCSCEVDLDARRVLPVKQWCALQAGGQGSALLLWRLANAEQLLAPSSDEAAAAAGAGAADADGGAGAAAAAAAEGEAGALLSLLGQGPDVARLLTLSGDALRPPVAGVAAWAGKLLLGSTGAYAPPQPPQPQPQLPGQPPAAPPAGIGDEGGAGTAERGNDPGSEDEEHRQGGADAAPAAGSEGRAAGRDGAQRQQGSATPLAAVGPGARTRGRAAGTAGGADGGASDTDGRGRQPTRAAGGGGGRRLRQPSSSGRGGGGGAKGGLSFSHVR